jgi:hypothetical protein
LLRKLCSRKIVFFVLLSLFSFLVMVPPAIAKAKRGEEPQCQEECLAKHSARMKLLSEEYLKIGNKMNYQDAVEDEASRYFHCLTNCRELIPVK